MVGEDGFEPPNPKELIYSQPRLASSHIRPYNCPTAFNDVRAWSIINNLGGGMGVEPIHNVVTAHRVRRFTNLRKLSLEPHERIELSTSGILLLN